MAQTKVPPTQISNPLKFSVYRNAAHTSSTTGSVILYDTELFDSSNTYDTATGRFTAPVAGYYWFNASGGNTAATSTIMYMSLRKNGTVVKVGDARTPSVANNLLIVSGMIQLAATDYVDAVFVGGGGSTMSVGQQNCYFEGFMVSAT